MATATTTRTRKSTAAAKAAPKAVEATPAKADATPVAPVEATPVATPATAAKVVLADADRKAIETAAKKEASDLHRNFQAWLESAEGVVVDLETVKMVCALRHTFQKSETNQAHLSNRRTAAEEKAIAQAKAAEEKAAKAMAKAKAMQAKLAKANKASKAATAK